MSAKIVRAAKRRRTASSWERIRLGRPERGGGSYNLGRGGSSARLEQGAFNPRVAGSNPARPTERQLPAVASHRGGRRDERARRRMARADPGNAEGTDARAAGSPAAGPPGGDALPALSERPDVRHERADRGRLPGPRDAGARGAAMPAAPARRASATYASRPRVRRPIGARGRGSIQPSSPSTVVITIAPSAAAPTISRVATQGAHRGRAIGSLRERSGSTKPSHSSTTRRSR
jgi:hypothetical protein